MNEIYYTLFETLLVTFLIVGSVLSVFLTALLYKLFRLSSKNPKLAMIVIFNRGKEFFKTIGIAAFGIAVFNISGTIFSNLLFPGDKKMMYLFYSLLSISSVLFLILPIIKTYKLKEALKETL